MSPSSETLGINPSGIDPEALKYDERGLLPVVAQDVATGTVLMLAWADKDAVQKTLETGDGWFWSRSRRELWRKGDTSGNVLKVVEVAADCDADSLLYRVHPVGPACHKNTRSCFEPEGGPSLGELEVGWLHRVLEARKASGDTDSSYTARLLHKGRPRIAQKVAEEAAETVIASLTLDRPRDDGKDPRDELVGEAGDLIYHLLVLLLDCGVPPREVAAKLAARHRPAAGGS